MLFFVVLVILIVVVAEEKDAVEKGTVANENIIIKRNTEVTDQNLNKLLKGMSGSQQIITETIMLSIYTLRTTLKDALSLSSIFEYTDKRKHFLYEASWITILSFIKTRFIRVHFTVMAYDTWASIVVALYV